LKKILLALGFTVIATSAQAITMSNLNLNTYGTNIMFNGTNGVVNTNTGVFGQLSATQNTTLKFTFLGKDAANTNYLILNGLIVAGSGTNTVTKNDSFLSNVSAGVVDFGFTGNGGVKASNTTNLQENIAFLENVDSIGDAAGNPFAFLVGFNDGGSADADFNDYVIGVNELSAVPVPAALPLLASALGAFGIARRRNKAKRSLAIDTQ